MNSILFLKTNLNYFFLSCHTTTWYGTSNSLWVLSTSHISYLESFYCWSLSNFKRHPVEIADFFWHFCSSKFSGVWRKRTWNKGQYRGFSPCFCTACQSESDCPVITFGMLKQPILHRHVMQWLQCCALESFSAFSTKVINSVTCLLYCLSCVFRSYVLLSYVDLNNRKLLLSIGSISID